MTSTNEKELKGEKKNEKVSSQSQTKLKKIKAESFCWMCAFVCMCEAHFLITSFEL